MKTIIKWRVFFVLWIAAILSSSAILPYALELQGPMLESMDLPIPFPALIALQIVQSAILFGVIIFAGMFFASRVGLGTPILDSVTRGESASDNLRAILPISIGLGVVASLLIIGIDLLLQSVLSKELGDTANTLNLQNIHPAAWKGFLAAFYGGIAEEILLRLLVMSLLAWLGGFVSKTQDGKPTSAVFWIANILAAVLFGLGHLPATATFLPLTPLVITRAILLNGIGGVIFGWLYWKRGLESAMVAHFSADIVLHVLFVFIIGE